MISTSGRCGTMDAANSERAAHPARKLKKGATLEPLEADLFKEGGLARASRIALRQCGAATISKRQK